MVKCIVMKSYAVSLVIPCYNESEHLADSLPRVLNVLKKLKKSFEIIIVDDNSHDNTQEIIKKFIQKYKTSDTQFVQHKKNVGRGGTVTEGLMLSRGEIVGFIDIDLEISPDYIPQFLEIIDTKKADIVVGKRYYPFLLNSLHRYIASRVYSALVQLILKLPISDTEAGYKFFRRKKILPVLRSVKDAKWFWDTEVIAMSTEKGLKISEIDVLFERRRDKTSTVHIFKDSFGYLISLIAYRATHRKNI